MSGSVALVRDENIERGIGGALELAGNLAPLLVQKHVAIKPNDTWATPADLTACTQADTVRAVIRYVKRFNPSRITVSGGSGAGETQEIFHLLGIDTVIRREGVEFFDHNRGPFVQIELDYGPQPKVLVNPHILDYQTLISLAQHKVHNAAAVTLTMKNIAMSFPAADYYGHPRDSYMQPHHFFKDLHAFIAGMCKRFPPAIGIIVGHPAMVGQGPLGGTTFESDLFIAGMDFVACDAIGAYLLGKKNVRHIELAGDIGLGTAAIDLITVKGLPLDYAIELFQRKSVMASYA
jgi:uncharacterized protein (DUF362 family)